MHLLHDGELRGRQPKFGDGIDAKDRQRLHSMLFDLYVKNGSYDTGASGNTEQTGAILFLVNESREEHMDNGSNISSLSMASTKGYAISQRSSDDELRIARAARATAAAEQEAAQALAEATQAKVRVAKADLELVNIEIDVEQRCRTSRESRGTPTKRACASIVASAR